MILLLVIGAAIVLVPLVAGLIAVILQGRRTAGRHGPAALLFHSVPQSGIDGLSYTTVETCTSLLDYLAESGYTTLTVGEACAGPSKARGSMRVVVLTFDDGFEDFYAHVMPRLGRHGMRVTVFPIASFIGKNSKWDIYAPRKHLSTTQIREIAAAGHEIGSHTMTHPDLVLLSAADLKRELGDSKKLLEDMLGKPVESISFPFGRWNRRIWKHAQACGYKYATVYGNHTPDGDCFVHVDGTYSFDTLGDIIEKIERRMPFSNSCARSRIMPHYAKGSPIWLFRKNYRIIHADR